MVLSMSLLTLSIIFNCKGGIINNISQLFSLLEGWESSSNGIVPAQRLQCTSSNLEVLLILIMVLCNLSTCPGYQIKFVEENGLPTVNQLLTSLFPLISKCATMIICNLTSHKLLQDHVSRQISQIHLFDLMNGNNLEMQGICYNDSIQFGIKD